MITKLNMVSIQQPVNNRRAVNHRPVKAAKAAKQSNRLKRARSTKSEPSVGRVATFDFEKSFPTAKEMKRPEIWEAMVEYAKNTANKRVKDGHAALRNEMKCIYGLATHFVSHHGDYEQFREMKAIDCKSTATPKILSEVLYEYTGRDKEQKKTASKYKQQLLPSLEEGLSVGEFDKLIEEVGGVFNLKKPPPPKPKLENADDASKSDDDVNVEVANRTLVVEPCKIAFRLKRGSTQTVDFKNCTKSMAEFVVTIRRSKSDESEELFLGEDDTHIDPLMHGNEDEND